MPNLDFPPMRGPADSQIPIHYIDTVSQARMCLDLLRKEDLLGVDTETTGLDPHTCKLFLVQVGNPRIGCYVFDARSLDIGTLLKDLLEDPKILKVLQNAVFDYKFLSHHYGIAMTHIYDTMLAEMTITAGQYFGGEARKQAGLARQCAKYLKIDLNKELRDWFSKLPHDFNFATKPELIRYAALDVYYPLYIYRMQRDLLIDKELVKAVKVDFDLIPVISAMELHGVTINEKLWRRILAAVEEKFYAVERRIHILLNKKAKQGVLWDDAPVTNISSTKQILDALNDSFDYELQNTQYLTLLEHQEDELIQNLLEYRALDKIRTAYGTELLDKINPVTKKMHPSYSSLGAAQTGRFCIAKGTPVETMRDLSVYPEPPKIEDVRVGDYVYCYDNNLNITLRRVLRAGCTGALPVIRVHWEGTGHHHSGYLDLTATHKVRLISGEYREAGKLCAGDSILALHREIGPVISRLYQTGIKDPLYDHRVVFQAFTGEQPEVVHHLDENRKNNHISNLRGMPRTEHSRHHGTNCPEERKRRRLLGLKKAQAASRSYRVGPDHPNWLGLTKEWMEEVLWLHAGKPTCFRDVYGIDYETAQKYMTLYNIDYHIIAENFTKRGDLIDYDFYRKAKTIVRGKDMMKRLVEMGIGWVRWQRIQEKFEGVPQPVNNHRITKIENLNMWYPVYNLEVEEFHNFIAAELCVSNSSAAPNAQQMPTDSYDVGGKSVKIRDCFVASPGYKFIGADYSQQEVRVAAFEFKEPLLEEVYRADKDIYKTIASLIFSIPYDVLTKDSYERKLCKEVVLGSNYGGGAGVVRRSCLKAGLNLSLEEAQAHLRSYKETVPTMVNNMNAYAIKCLEKGVIEFGFGKKRFVHHLIHQMKEFKKNSEEYREIEAKVLRIAKNTRVQGNSAIMTKLALLGIWKRILNNKWDACPVLVVHDEIVVEAKEDCVHDVSSAVKEEMEKAFQIICPGFPNKVDVTISDRWIKD